MVKQYIHLRFPVEAYPNLINKKRKMEDTIKVIMKKPNVNLPLTKVFVAITENQVDIHPEYLVKLYKKK